MMQKVPEGEGKHGGGRGSREGEGKERKRERRRFITFLNFLLNKKNEKMQVKGNLLTRSIFGNIHREGNSIKAASRSDNCLVLDKLRMPLFGRT